MFSRFVPGIACSIALGLCLAQATRDNDRWTSSTQKDLSLRGGTSRPYSSSFFSQNMNVLACGTGNPAALNCYNTGGHDFLCQDQSKAWQTGSSGNQYTTTINTACTPLFRYNSITTTCSGQDTTFLADCDTSKTLYSDP